MGTLARSIIQGDNVLFKGLNRWLGVCTLIFSVFYAFYAIPNWVYSPSNIRNIVLSPTFWPYVLAGILAIAGIALIVTKQTPSSDEDVPTTAIVGARPYVRLLILAFIMALTMYLLPRLGMVWTTMLTFVSTAFFFGTRYPKAAVISAVLVPLILYAFFAHVAGVAIPQGNFVRLP